MMKSRSPLRKLSKKKLAQNGGKVPYGTISTPRKAIKKKSRKKSEFARIYGSKERVEWVKLQACAACGVVGYSENAHVAPPSEKGTGYKAGYEWIAPLCGYQKGPESGDYRLGCHEMLHAFGKSYFDRKYPDFSASKAAADTEQAWLEFQRTSK